MSACAFTFFPWPSQLFSTTLNAIDVPSVPTPKPALISPVGFSSIDISKIFVFVSDPFLIGNLRL